MFYMGWTIKVGTDAWIYQEIDNVHLPSFRKAIVEAKARFPPAESPPIDNKS